MRDKVERCVLLSGMAEDLAPIPAGLTAMKEKLAEWRGTQRPRTQLPD